jgi:hypothetical protein
MVTESVVDQVQNQPYLVSRIMNLHAEKSIDDANLPPKARAHSVGDQQME